MFNHLNNIIRVCLETLNSFAQITECKYKEPILISKSTAAEQIL